MKVAQSYFFSRPGHRFHGAEVTVLRVREEGFDVAPAEDVVTQLLASPRKKRVVATWLAAREELSE